MAKRKKFQTPPQPLKHKDEWKKYIASPQAVKDINRMQAYISTVVSRIEEISGGGTFTKYNFKLIPGLPLYRLDTLETVD